MTPGTGNYSGFGGHGGEEPGKGPQFPGLVSSGSRATANELSAKLGTFPELDRHVLVDSKCLKLKGKALLGVDLLCSVVKAADEKVLEDCLEKKPSLKP